MGKESLGCGVPRTEASLYSGYRDTQEVRDVFPSNINSDLNQRCILRSTEGLETIDAYAPCPWLWFHWSGYGFVRKFSKRFLEELNFIQERNTSLKWEAVSWGLELNPGRYSATQLYHQGKPQTDAGKPLKWCSPWGAMLKSPVVSSWVGPALDDHEGSNWNLVHLGGVESTPPGPCPSSSPLHMSSWHWGKLWKKMRYQVYVAAPHDSQDWRAGGSVLCCSDWHFSLTTHFLSRQFGQLPCLVLSDDSTLNLYDTYSF